MRTPYCTLLLLIVLGGFFSRCTEPQSPPEIELDRINDFLVQDSVLFSFAFVGCNRIDRGDRHKEAANKNGSTANVPVLNRIFEDIDALPKTPDLFFFLGDLVLGETNTNKLNSELAAWKTFYQDSLARRNMELVAVPGNHEMLYYEQSDGNEYPLNGATDVWLQYMNEYMPTSRTTAPSTDSMDNKLTFSFTRGNVGFVVMNTDTYNPPNNEHPFGAESRVPIDWINKELARLQRKPDIEHVFVLGHKPHYISKTDTAQGHDGIHDGEKIWQQMENTHALAMLSAHKHWYDCFQVDDKVTQVIAGNGGSTMPKEFGYSLIQIMQSGKVELISKGYKVTHPYYGENNNPFHTKPTVELNWNAASLKN